MVLVVVWNRGTPTWDAANLHETAWVTFEGTTFSMATRQKHSKTCVVFFFFSPSHPSNMSISFLHYQFERSLCCVILWAWKVFTFIKIPNSRLNLFTIYVHMSKKEENKDDVRIALFIKPAMLYSRANCSNTPLVQCCRNTSYRCVCFEWILCMTCTHTGMIISALQAVHQPIQPH